MKTNFALKKELSVPLEQMRMDTGASTIQDTENTVPGNSDHLERKLFQALMIQPLSPLRRCTDKRDAPAMFHKLPQGPSKWPPRGYRSKPGFLETSSESRGEGLENSMALEELARQYNGDHPHPQA